MLANKTKGSSHRLCWTRHGAMSRVLIVATGMLLMLSGPVACSQQVPPQFFGMHLSVKVLRLETWPSVPFSGIRLWDTKTGWAQLNPSAGRYDWQVLDQWLNQAQKHDVDVLYTFGHTPGWASSDPRDDSCGYEPGACAPPDDLKQDGTGSDQRWKDFVTAIAKHSAGRIKYWEIWNEPINRKMWVGTTAQLLRMAKDAATIIKSIDPAAVILTPTLAMGTDRARNWTNDYLAGGGGDSADVISFHAYLPVPEDVLSVIQSLRSTLSRYGQGSKPLWQTEGSWGRTRGIGFNDEDEQVDYVLRLYPLLASNGVARFYWYAWDNPGWGTMWSVGEIRPPGKAYETVHKWLLGATFENPCRQDGDLWKCNFVSSSNRRASIVWKANSGGTKAYEPPPAFSTAHTADGNSFRVHGAIPISTRPVLLE